MSAAFPPVSQAGRQLAAGTALTSAVHERPTPENCVTAFGTVAPRLAANGYRPLPIRNGTKRLAIPFSELPEVTEDQIAAFIKAEQAWPGWACR